MAWTAPMTFVADTALTAAQLNTYLRDNLQETMVAKSTTNGSMFYGTDTNELVERKPAFGRSTGTYRRTSTSYGDAPIPGPIVTVETGTTAMILMSAHMGNSTVDSQACMSYAITGATSAAAEDARGLEVDGIEAVIANYLGVCGMDMRDDLVPGTNTFTMKYRAGSGVAYFAHRFLCVWPLG